MKIFSERLKCERKLKGLSQKGAAEALNISYGAYKNYELLGTKNGREPPMETICRIAKFFNVSADYLLGLED